MQKLFVDVSVWEWVCETQETQKTPQQSPNLAVQGGRSPVFILNSTATSPKAPTPPHPGSAAFHTRKREYRTLEHASTGAGPWVRNACVQQPPCTRLGAVCCWITLPALKRVELEPACNY